MRNLIFFFYKYYTFILFFILELFSFVVLYQYNNYQRASFLNYTSGVASTFYEKVNSTTNYFELRDINDSLMAENARLRAQMLNAYYQTGFTQTSINDSVYKQQYSYIAANVVNNSVTKLNNYITIDKGSEAGIEPDMGVIGSNGVVGIVTSVSEHYATIRSALNSNTKISCMLKKNNAFGSLEWNGDSPKFSSLKYVNKHVEITSNDEIVTSNYSKLFPQGIPVGRVFSHSLDAGDNFHYIKVELNTDFSTLKNVYVVKNILKNEQQNLESTLKGGN
ncbi:MAG: rod shape-determining protein MreC [Bacteroidia bacterium]|nr:rod shape-determining protein MreC [Bacteroidia bacterium]MCF8425911.1 rod shape-determining protein MreC [Bacteroidia bacterium]MCF8446148.1 rod shape-determining protein MreC [Bacteroidia bacterium]